MASPIAILCCSKVPEHSACRGKLRCRFGDTVVEARLDEEILSVVCQRNAPEATSGFWLIHDILDEDGSAILTKQEGVVLNSDVSKNSSGDHSSLFAASVGATGLLKKLSWIDRYLYVWIFLTMAAGVLIGEFVSPVPRALNRVKIVTVSLPITLGLWLMMWPVLTKVRYELLANLLEERKVWNQIGISCVLNWLVGPALMTGLAWATLPDLPGYRTGIIIIGIARCIAMVLIWNQLAGGSAELCAFLVAINSVLQVILFSPLSLFYLNVVSRSSGISLSFWPIARSVLIFLGVPLAGGVLTRYAIIILKGRQWLDSVFLPWFGPCALLGLLYTIFIMFASQAHEIVDNIGDVFRTAVPLVMYFAIMFTSSMFMSVKHGDKYEVAVTQAFTASGNNFELAIAVAVGTWGITSQEALAATVGPLIEVPVLISLVYFTLWLRKKLQWK